MSKGAGKWRPVWVRKGESNPPRWRRGWQWKEDAKQAAKKKTQKHREPTIGELSLEYALTQVGYEEHPPGTNLNKYGRRWKENGVAWCSLFAMTTWVEGGAKQIADHILYLDYVPQVHSDSVNRKYGMGPVKNLRKLQPGDAVGYWGDRHIGIFYKWLDKKSGTFKGIEGNTSGSDPTNGGMVAITTRSLSDVSFGARIYK